MTAVCSVCRVPHAKDWAGAEVSRAVSGYDDRLSSHRYVSEHWNPSVNPETSHTALSSCLSTGMDIINGAIESLLSSTGKEDWIPVILSIADTTLAVIKEKAGRCFLQINKQSLLIRDQITNTQTQQSVSAGRRRRGGRRVSRPFLVLHGCGTGRAHIRLYYGHREPAFPVSRVLVRSKRWQCVWGCANCMCGEFSSNSGPGWVKVNLSEHAVACFTLLFIFDAGPCF